MIETGRNLYDVRVPADPERAEVVGVENGGCVDLHNDWTATTVPQRRATVVPAAEDQLIRLPVGVAVHGRQSHVCVGSRSYAERHVTLLGHAHFRQILVVVDGWRQNRYEVF